MRGVVGVTTAGAGLALDLASAPLWAVAVTVVFGFLLASIDAVFPQESHDRLEWWRHVLPGRSGGGPAPPGKSGD
jgi:hypothetical protein